jgi:hypothetical protein
MNFVYALHECGEMQEKEVEDPYPSLAYPFFCCLLTCCFNVCIVSIIDVDQAILFRLRIFISSLFLDPSAACFSRCSSTTFAIELLLLDTVLKE